MDISPKEPLSKILILTIVFFVLTIFITGTNNFLNIKNAKSLTSIISPTPTPFNPFPYKLPQIPNSRSYRIMLVGDSIVGSLGVNAPLLRQHLIELYPTHEFVNYNYGFGATSIETLPDRLTKETTYNGQAYQSILSQGFDLIIIESFAYNPLSQDSVGEGIKKHLKILDESIKQIILTKPESAIAIMTPIAPNKSRFAEGVYELPIEERIKWAQERESYIKAVINYAKENSIPLINVFELTLTEEGDGNLKYINKDDYIHPSTEGVDLIARTIAEFIFNAKIFPE